MTIRATIGVVVAWCVVGIGVGASNASAQQQEPPKNLQYFPADITRPELIQKMREFSFALDVRCEFCHVQGPGGTFNDMVFESDEKPTKRRARYMLGMVDTINSTLLANVPERSVPNLSVECATCHRGSAVPKLLDTVLSEVIATDGAAAAVARYKELREDQVSGRYSFSEWTINELARELRVAGDEASAIAMLEMNAEYYPDSNGIEMALAQLYETRDRDHAIALYRRVLERQPQNRGAQEALGRLEREPAAPR